MLEKALAGNGERIDSQNDMDQTPSSTRERRFYTDTFQSYIKTAETVAAKGVPLLVKKGECTLKDCVGCFWEPLCEREAEQKMIDRGRDIVKKAWDSIREADAREARAARKDRAERERDRAYTV